MHCLFLATREQSVDQEVTIFCCRLTGVSARDGRRARLSNCDSVGSGGVADRVGVSILHGPSTEHRAGDSDSELSVAAAAGVSAHPPSDSSHAHSGRRHSKESAGEGGWRVGRARVSRLATGRRQNHSLCTYQVCDKVATKIGARLLIVYFLIDATTCPST